MQPYEGSHQLLQIFASMMALGLQESGCRLLWLRDPFDQRAMPHDALRRLAETVFSPTSMANAIAPASLGKTTICASRVVLPIPGSQSIMIRTLYLWKSIRDSCPLVRSPLLRSYGALIVARLAAQSTTSSRLASTSKSVLLVKRHVDGRSGVNETLLRCALRERQPAWAVQILQPSSMPLERQVTAFAGADAIVSRHGAALFWLICMRERSIVFEYGTMAGISVAFYHYQMLARYVGLRHVTVDPSGGEASVASLIVDTLNEGGSVA